MPIPRTVVHWLLFGLALAGCSRTDAAGVGGDGGGISACAADPEATTVGPGRVIALSAGLSHVCVLFDQGSVACWGSNDYGQLGVGRGCLYSSAVPLRVRNVTDAVAISAGMLHTCALLSDGSVKCWGEQPPGIVDSTCPVDPGIAQSACEVIVSSGVPEEVGTSPGIVRGLSGSTEISGGNHFDCSLGSAGEVRCWGDQAYGVLGDGSSGGAEIATPVQVVGLAPAAGVAAGLFHACAVLDDGTAACWGANESGELGDGTTTMAIEPTAVANLEGVTSVVAGTTAGSPNCAACYAFTCALLADYTVKCWGSGQDGELGDGLPHSDATTAPELVPAVSNVRSLVAGPGKLLAILMDGTLESWGSNRCGELGDGNMATLSGPVVAKGVDHVVAVAATECSTCALRDDGSVICWGDGGGGVLGNGESSASLVPVPVIGL